MKNVAVFASGSGSNAENLVHYFEHHKNIAIKLMVSDRKHAFVFERMQRLGIPSYYMSKQDFESGAVLKLLQENEIDFIVLAGFLKLMPPQIIHAFSKQIINIHPALLPQYGGKGMYGLHVHEAVVKAGENKSGITIHYVNENFDEGEIIEQFETALIVTDNAEMVAKKIHELEMKYFPQVVERVISDRS
jgi:phosphoribosylglycinamide formyltransferase 1